MEETTLQFGVEIELLLGSRKKSHGSWKALAKDLSKRLAKAGIANHINDSNDKSPDNYREWSIVPEVTIPSQPHKGLYGIELVSPIYPIHHPWSADLSRIFSTLHNNNNHYTVHPSPHCATHIHLSGTPIPLDASCLASLAKAALYYEPALDLLVPSSRRGSSGSSSGSSSGTSSYWCQSNRSSVALKRFGTLGECLSFIDAVAFSSSSDDDDGDETGKGSGKGKVRPIVEAMNLFPASSAYGRAHGKHKDFVRGKVYKWDFSGMLLSPSSSSSSSSGSGSVRGTVEFRQPSGSLVADDAAGWITLAAAFVAGAMVVGPSLGGDVGDRGASPEELWALLVSGGEMLGWDGLGAVEGLFARRG